MKEKGIVARNDGCLQIAVPDAQNKGNKIIWTRQYYIVPLEVRSV